MVLQDRSTMGAYPRTALEDSGYLPAANNHGSTAHGALLYCASRTCCFYQRLFTSRAPLLSPAPGPSMLEGCLGSPKHCLKKKQPSLGRAREEGWLPGDVADTPKGGRRGGAPASTSRGERNAGKHVSHEGASSANSVLLYYREHRTQLCNKFESPDQIELWKI